MRVGLLLEPLHRDQISSIFPTFSWTIKLKEGNQMMSSMKKRAKRKKEVAHVEDLGPTKDARGGAQKKEVPASKQPFLQH